MNETTYKRSCWALLGTTVAATLLGLGLWVQSTGADENDYSTDLRHALWCDSLRLSQAECKEAY